MTINVFDQTPPNRPTVADVGGEAFVDDVEYPPRPGEQQTADEGNQVAGLTRRMAGLAPVAVVTVRYSAGVPFVYLVESLRDDVDASSFTLTQNSATDVTVEWDLAKFPSQIADPVAMVTGTTPTTIATERLGSAPTGARVRTGAQAPFVLVIR